MRAKALAALFLLAGCDRPPTDNSMDAAHQEWRIIQLRDQVSALERRVAEDERREQLQREWLGSLSNLVETQGNYIRSVDTAEEHLANQVTNNARVYNGHLRTER